MHSIQALKHIVDEMRASSKRVLEYSKNRSATGLQRERILEAYLKKITPDAFDIGSGFIYDQDSPSKQVDILIYDKLNYAPLFDEGGYKIILPSSTVHAIEVKSFLGKQDLQEAFDNIISATSLNQKIHGSIFAFDGSSAEKVFDYIQEYAEANLSNGMIPLLPRIIVCLDKWIIINRSVQNERTKFCVEYHYPKSKAFEELFLFFFSEIYFTLYGYRRKLHREGALPSLKEQGFHLNLQADQTSCLRLCSK